MNVIGRRHRIERKRALGVGLGVCLVACAALAALILLPGRGTSGAGRALSGRFTLGQAPAGLRAAVERDERESLAESKRWELHAAYQAGGVRLSGPGWSARVGLGSVGRAAALVPVSGVVSHGALDALYGRSGVSESFTSGPLGVIQTFEVAKRPSGPGQLVLEFEISGLRATGSGARLNLRGARNKVVASYRYLRVTDARGRVVKASMRPSSGGREIVLEVADRHAQYPLHIEPIFAAHNGPKLAVAAAPARSVVRASYGSDSVRLSGPKLSGTVGLGEVGRAGALSPVSGALERGSHGALYRGSGITETFTDGLTGVEQSFKITKRPGGSGPLLLRVGLSGLLASGSGSTLALHGASGAVVGAYSGLRVTDADGRVVKASMSPGPDGRGIVISVDDRSARYPLLVDPTYTQIAEVTDLTSGSAFGDAVAVSGSTALIGASGSANGGEAYIYTSTGGNWTATQTLTVPASAPVGTSGFGSAVAISGSTAVVSASSGGLGVAYVYTLSGGVWNYTAELTDGVSGDEFGSSVAVSGSTIVVGAPDQTVDENTDVGATYIYNTDSGANWFNNPVDLTPSDNDAYDHFGGSVAISESGTTVVAGANDDAADSIPSAYVYTLSDGSWSQAQELVAPNATTTYGVPAAVAISGSTIVMGGSEFINGDAGQAYVYTNPGSGWSLAATLNPADSGGYFGSAVAISGGTIVIGAFGHSVNGPADEGAAYVFTGSGSSWTQQPTDLLASDVARAEEFGAVVAVSGSAILIGNRSTNGGVTDAYFFGPEPTQTGPTFTVTNTSDSNDGACYVGDCSLRDAITAANAYPTADGEPTIAFDLPAGVQTISPATPLPAITNAMKIDGTTDPGYPGSFAEPDFPATVDSPLVEIDGSSCTASCDGLDVSAEEVTIEGLAIEGFPEAGIVLTGAGQNTITKDWIGENPATQALDGNAYYGIEISASANNLIDDDLVAGNGGALVTYSDGANIEITGGASFGNTLSLDDLTGDPNGPTTGQDSQGIVIETGAADNTIGGLGPDNDVINGYIDNGVELDDAGSGNAIQGDAIGVTGGPHPHLLGDGGQGTGIEVAYTSGTVIGDDAAPGTQANTARGNEIDGNAQSGSVGIAVNDDSSDTTIAGNYIGTDSAGDSGLGNFEGVAVGSGSSTANVIGPGNTIADNTGTSVNGASGVELDGPGNVVTANSIHDNGGPGIGGYYSSVLTAPTLTANSTQDGSATAINGTVTGTAGSSVAIDVFDSPACGNGQGETYLGTQDVTIGSGGTGSFSVASAEPTAGDSITATATTAVADPANPSLPPTPSTSVFSGCSTVISTGANDEWTDAQLITPDSSGAGSATGSIDLSGQARWYKVPINPGGSVTVNLTNLPADYNLALFSDIGQAEASLTSNDSDEPTTENLQALQAEQPGNAFSPSVFSPSVFSPSVFSPSVFSPSVFSPSVFSPSVFSPSVFSPSVFSPSVFSPSVFSPSVVSPSVFSPSVFSPSVFSPSVFSPSTPVLDAEDYEDAQIDSLLSVSDNSGAGNQQVSADTWNNTGYFYIRVSGANGAYAPGQDFSLGVQVNSGTCGGVESMDSTPLLSSTYTVPSSSYHTLILTDESRMTNDGDLATMESHLTTFAGESSVDGTILDVGTDSPRVEALQSQADQNADCPEAENLVAGAIQQIVGTVRQDNPGLKYIVIVGDDHVIPFFRYPDTAGLAAESGYVPPVLDTTPSYASLESDDFLSDDAYGSSTVLSAGGEDIPVPDLPVGRLVTTPTEIDDMLQAYLSTPSGDGVLPTPTSSLVTGYDFMTASADAVESNLAAGLGPNATNDTLITNDGVAPSDTGSPPTQSWTATQLESELLGKRHDLIYIAGHFSANNTLAADDSTTMNATQLANSNVDLTNSIVFSAGCHSGYNITSEDAVPGVTQTTDWVGAFAQHGATLIAGTGYQYGDTDFLAYSDQLYDDFSQQLLAGSGNVAVGDALADAKNEYLDDTPDLQGIDIKSVLEATLYGLPMLSIDMPDGRTGTPTASSIVGSSTPNPLTAETTDPGLTLGLSSASLTLTPSLTSNSVPLESPTGTQLSTSATYYSGPNGVEVNPAEPTLPLSVSDVSVPNQVLRGVGFTGGTYTDQSGITPLTGAPTSDLSSEHSTFASNTFFPSQLYTVNYFGGLNGGPASTKLNLTPAQYESDAPGSLTDEQRTYSSVGLQLFYSDNTKTYGSNTPALAAPPSIGEVSATAASASSATASDGSVTFQAHVDGDPSAGIQKVWVTYTDPPSSGTGEWQSVDLTQSPTDSTLWTGTLSGLSTAQISDLDFMVQAVNGVGLVGVDDNNGAYFQPGQIPPVLQTAGSLTPTTLTLNSPPTSGSYGSEASVSATLTDGSGPIAGQLVSFTIGDSTVEGETDNNGVATAQIPLDDVPGGSYSLTAGYGGNATLAGASASSLSFAVDQLSTTLTLRVPASVTPGASPTGISATLESGGVGLSQYSVEFVLTPTDGTSGGPVVETALTSLGGVAQLPSVASLAAGGQYSVAAYFGLGPSSSTIPNFSLTNPIFANSSATPVALAVAGQAPAFTSAASATFTAGSAGSFAITTTGVPANTISVGTGSGCAALPTGLALSGTGNDVSLSGTPAAGTGGSYAVCLTASNGVGTAAKQAFTLTVDQAPAFTSAASATFTVGSAGSFAVTTTGYPVSAVAVGTGSGCSALPKGLSLSAAGALTGTPAAGTGGSYAVCLTASNGVGNAAAQAFTLKVVGQSPQSITPSTPPASASVGGATYAPSASASSGLPVAISLDASSTGCSLSSGGVVSFTGIGTCVIDFNQAGNAAYAPAPLVQQSIGVALVTEVDDAPSSAVGYSGSGWTNGLTGCQNFDCTESFSLTAGNYATFTFTGTGVQWIAPKSSNGGYANVYVDGSLVASNVTTYAASTTYQQVIWSDQGLSNGPHTLKIVVLGTKPAASTNTYVQIDAFIATAAQKLSQSISVTSTAPASPITATAGGPTYTPSATSSSGLPVAITLDSSSSGCSLSGGVVSFTGVGTCVIDFNQAGNGIYAAAPPQRQSIKITGLVVDDAPSSAVSYGGLGWTHGQTGCQNVDCTESFSLTAGNTVQFTFTGTGVQWIAPKSNNGGYADIYVDGVLVASNVTTYAAATTYQQVIWSDQGLSNGPHTLKIVVLGTKPAASTNTYVQIDAFDVT